MTKLDQTPEEQYENVTSAAPSALFTLRRMHSDANGNPVARNETIRLQMLTKREEMQAIADAQKTAKQIGELPGFNDVYREAQTLELMSRALRDLEQRERPDGTRYYPQRFTSGSHLSEKFTSADLALLLNHYESLLESYRSLETLEPGDIELWIAKLSDPMRRFDFLGQLSSSDWLALTFALATYTRNLLRVSGQESRLPSLDFLGSESKTSEPDTTSSSGQPNVWSSEPNDPALSPSASMDGIEIPADIEEAKALVRELRRKKGRDE